MPNSAQIEVHRHVQTIAKQVLQQVGAAIGPADTERSIVGKSVHRLAQAGVAHTWYYDCPALVLLGSRSCLSISGRDYQPADELVGQFNVITVDLSPLLDGLWGDCARTFIVEEGVVRERPKAQHFRLGLGSLRSIHRKVQQFARPQRTFEELFHFTNDHIRELGCTNLDAWQNVGHSIESNLADRVFIEARNTRPLGSCDFFTVEPHIGAPGEPWGYKHEEIYYFDANGRLAVL